MVIELRLHDVLKRYVPSSSTGIVAVDVSDNITVGELLFELEINQDEVGYVTVNGVVSNFEQLLNDGDRIGLFTK